MKNVLIIGMLVVASLFIIIIWLSASLINFQKILRLQKQQQEIWLNNANIALSEIKLINNGNIQQVTELISKVTSLQAWFLELKETPITEGHLVNSPFWIDPYLTNMAIQTGKKVVQHQLIQYDVAFAYIPLLKYKKYMELWPWPPTKIITI